MLFLFEENFFDYQPYIFLFKSIFSLLDSAVFSIDCIVNSLPYFNTASATSPTVLSHSGNATDQPNSVAWSTNFCPGASLSGTTITCLPSPSISSLCVSFTSDPSMLTPETAMASNGPSVTNTNFLVQSCASMLNT